MKKNLFFGVMLILILMLVACNTTDEPPTEPANGTVTTNEGKNDSGEITETDEKQNDSSKNGNVTEDDPEATPNGEDTTEVSGDLYTMQISTDFTFTPEEPGKDMVLYDENDKISMRIEALTKNDTTYEDLVTNTKEWMTAVSDQYDTNNIDALLTDQNITNATSFIANVEDEKVVTVVFEKGNILVRLTVFDLNDVNLTDKLIKMGLTIQEK